MALARVAPTQSGKFIGGARPPAPAPDRRCRRLQNHDVEQHVRFGAGGASAVAECSVPYRDTGMKFVAVTSMPALARCRGRCVGDMLAPVVIMLLMSRQNGRLSTTSQRKARWLPSVMQPRPSVVGAISSGVIFADGGKWWQGADTPSTPQNVGRTWVRVAELFAHVWPSYCSPSRRYPSNYPTTEPTSMAKGAD